MEFNIDVYTVEVVYVKKDVYLCIMCDFARGPGALVNLQSDCF